MTPEKIIPLLKSMQLEYGDGVEGDLWGEAAATIAGLEEELAELKTLIHRGYNLVKPPPSPAKYQNIRQKAEATWLDDVLEAILQGERNE